MSGPLDHCPHMYCYPELALERSYLYLKTGDFIMSNQSISNTCGPDLLFLLEGNLLSSLEAAISSSQTTCHVRA